MGKCAASTTTGLLACRQFRPLISDCYYNDGEAITRFVFELTKGEASKLIAEFEKRKTSGAAPQPRQLSATGSRKAAEAAAPKVGNAAPVALSPDEVSVNFVPPDDQSGPGDGCPAHKFR